MKNSIQAKSIIWERLEKGERICLRMILMGIYWYLSNFIDFQLDFPNHRANFLNYWPCEVSIEL
jgi:hypothetical protein